MNANYQDGKDRTEFFNITTIITRDTDTHDLWEW